MIHVVLIFGLLLVVIAVTMVLRALTTPAGPSTETLEQISAYGFAGSLPTASEPGLDVRTRVGDMTGALGRWLAQHFSRLRGKDYRARLIAAGMYTTSPERLLGTQFLGAVAGGVLMFSFTGLAGSPAWFVIVGTVGGVVLGWVLPMFIVDSRAASDASRSSERCPT